MGKERYKLVLLRDKETLIEMELSAEVKPTTRILYDENSFTILKAGDLLIAKKMLSLFYELLEEKEEE